MWVKRHWEMLPTDCERRNHAFVRVLPNDDDDDDDDDGDDFFFCDSDIVGENSENRCGRGTRDVPFFGTVPGVFLRIPHPEPLARSSGRRPGFSCDASSHSSSFSRWFVALVQVVKPLYKLLAAALIQLADLRDHLLDPLLILIMS